MDVVRHEHEFVELGDSAITIPKQRIEKHLGGAFVAEERLPLRGHCCDEEYALGKVHATAAENRLLKLAIFRPARSRVLPRCRPRLIFRWKILRVKYPSRTYWNPTYLPIADTELASNASATVEAPGFQPGE